MFLLVGPKRGGKGTIGRVLTGLLGAHHVAAPTLASLATNFGLQPLIGKPLALVSDARLSTKADSKIVVERLLSISGEDTLTIDRKYREPWTGRLPTRFVILTNELPGSPIPQARSRRGSSCSCSRRVFYGSENPQLTDELLDEAPAIFNWALEGLDRLNARGYFVNPGVRQGRHSANGGSVVAHLGLHPRSLRRRWTPARQGGHAVGAWKTWCEADNRPPGTKAVFGRDLRAPCRP